MTIPAFMNGVQWERVDTRSLPDDLPYVTHEGVIIFSGNSIRCYKLSTGEAIFDADDLIAFFGGLDT